MRGAVALALTAAGAILTFAVSAQVPGISLRLTGVIIILAGLAVPLLPPSPALAWLLRRGRPEREPTDSAPAAAPAAHLGVADLDAEYPAYLLQDPAVLAAEVLDGIRDDAWPRPEASLRGSGHGRPAGARPLHSVRLHTEDGVG